MAARAHRGQADLAEVLVLVRGIDQRHRARQERLRLRIVAERAVDLAHAHVADDQQVDRADALAEDERPLARLQREIGMADVAVVVAEEREDLRLPPLVAQLVGEPLRVLQHVEQPLMRAERDERIAQVAVEVERGFERALGSAAGAPARPSARSKWRNGLDAAELRGGDAARFAQVGERLVPRPRPAPRAGRGRRTPRCRRSASRMPRCRSRRRWCSSVS